MPTRTPDNKIVAAYFCAWVTALLTPVAVGVTTAAVIIDNFGYPLRGISTVMLLLSANRMAALIDEMLDAAHVQTGQLLELNRFPTDLVALAETVAEETRRSTTRRLMRTSGPSRRARNGRTRACRSDSTSPCPMSRR